MSDSDEDDASLAAAKFDSVFFAVDTKAKLDAGKPVEKEEEADKVLVASDKMYTEPTQEMKDHNVAVLKESEVNKVLSEKEDLKDVGGVFSGEVNEKNPLMAYCVAMLFHSSQEGVLELLRGTDKKTESTILPGLCGYPTHIGEHDEEAQKKVMTYLPGSFLKGVSKKMWPEMHGIYKEIQEKVGDSFQLQQGHLLFGWDKHTCFEFHQDTKEHKSEVHLSVIVELGMSQSSFAVAGAEKPFVYEKAGSFYAFDSNLWHRSGDSYSSTIKLAFFFSKVSHKAKKEDGVADGGAEEASTEEPKEPTGEVKNEESIDPAAISAEVQPSGAAGSSQEGAGAAGSSQKEAPDAAPSPAVKVKQEVKEPLKKRKVHA